MQLFQASNIRFIKLKRLFIILISFAFSILDIFAQYRPVEIPKRWTCVIPTPAYSLEDSSQKLGDYKAGITVRVLDYQDNPRYWKVAFERYGQPDIINLIDVPNLSLALPHAFAQVKEVINDFPILKILFESSEVWDKPPKLFSDYIFGRGNTFLSSGTKQKPVALTLGETSTRSSLWGMTPLSALVDFTNPKIPKIVIEIWNKGDASQSSIEPSNAHATIQRNLSAIQRAFPSYRKDPKISPRITAVPIRERVYMLPNGLRVAVRYDRGEYLFLEIESIIKLEENTLAPHNPEDFKRSIASRVKTSKNGHAYIDSIPMVDQGDKGYCAAATLARVLQYYSYSVDMHAMADLAKTEAVGGTRTEDIIKAMRRVCNSTPFRLQELRNTTPSAIGSIVRQGVPIIWFVPGHARLLIGIHPEKNEIVFSDSWGLEYQYQVGSWDYFMQNNEQMWVLSPR
jgi:hypothetical protein